MKEKIKKDIYYIQTDTKNICHKNSYLDMLNKLHDNFSEESKDEWLRTAQHHNARRYIQSFPYLKRKVDKSLNQLIRLGGGYVIEVTKDFFRWNECESKDLNQVTDYIWNSEIINKQKNEN